MPELTPYDKEKSLDIIKEISEIQSRFLEERGTRFVFLADEFYILAGLELNKKLRRRI